jgi:hypothetical protein
MTNRHTRDRGGVASRCCRFFTLASSSGPGSSSPSRSGGADLGLADVPRYKSRIFYRTHTEGPPANVLREEGGWSFGESFDHFGLVYYRVVDEETIYFCWRMYDQFRYLYPGYPTGELTRAASTDAVSSALESFLSFIDLN